MLKVKLGKSMKARRWPVFPAVVFMLVIFSAAWGSAQVSTTVLHSFPGVDGQNPFGSLTRSSDGATLYGMTYKGGAHSVGIIFSIPAGGTELTILHNFGDIDHDGENPRGSLTLSKDGGTLYGATPGGGANDIGTIFSYNIQTKTYTILHSFGGVLGGGYNPLGTLLLSSDGTTLYGTTHDGGSYNYGGTVFSFNISARTCTVLTSFNMYGSYWYPQGDLVSDGTSLYGMLQYTASGGGAVFKIGTDGSALTYLHIFQTGEGTFPQGLTLSKDGATLYGVADPSQAGWPGNGTIFMIGTSGGPLTVLHTFGDASVSNDGLYPRGSLTLSGDGDLLYGMTSGGGADGGGVVFSYRISTTAYAILHSFENVAYDGKFSFGWLTFSSDGATLYGMRRLDGVNGYGTIFGMDAAGTTYTVRHVFGDTEEGQRPYGSLTLSKDGATLYGLNSQGGAHGGGAIFRLGVGGGTVTDLHAFPDPLVSHDGVMPSGSLSLSADGATLYGMTAQGGVNNRGVLFSYNLGTSAYAVLHSFGDPDVTNDGQAPYYNSLTFSSGGDILFGMTSSGGAHGLGAIFSYNLGTSAYAILYSFGDVSNDGGMPCGDLTRSKNGAILYGMTSYGGTHNGGVLFSYTLSPAAYAILHSFGDVTDDGQAPYGSLTLSGDGTTLYGMTSQGGANNAGSIFSYNITSTAYSVLQAFKYGTETGMMPYGSLTLSGTTLYGMTYQGGANWNGTVFQLDTGSSGLTLLHSFGSETDDGAMPYGSLTLSGTTLLGMTNQGGAYGAGAIFSVTGALAIDLLSFTAIPSSFEVTLSWETGTEVHTAGFFLRRSLAREGPFVRITPLIPPAGETFQGAAYRYVDREVQVGATYYYQLEEVDDQGVSTLHGPIAARVAAWPVTPPSLEGPFIAQPPLVIGGPGEVERSSTDPEIAGENPQPAGRHPARPGLGPGATARSGAFPSGRGNCSRW